MFENVQSMILDNLKLMGLEGFPQRQSPCFISFHQTLRRDVNSRSE